MKRLAILDHREHKVHFYNISPSVKINEEYIYNLLGHTEDEWMTGDFDIVYHGETLG